jgi:hypothetical protein
MGQRGPKRVSAAILKARGSPLAPVRAREEEQARGYAPAQGPTQWPLPRELSHQTRALGRQFMAEASYDRREWQLLCQWLLCKEDRARLRRFLSEHGWSQVDKSGYARQRPESRVYLQLEALSLALSRELKIRD